MSELVTWLFIALDVLLAIGLFTLYQWCKMNSDHILKLYKNVIELEVKTKDVYPNAEEVK